MSGACKICGRWSLQCELCITRCGIGAAKRGKLPVRWSIKQSFFLTLVCQAESRLQEVDAQHGLQLKGGSAVLGSLCMRLGQFKQLSSRHHPLHVIEKCCLAYILAAQIKPKITLFGFYGAIVRVALMTSEPESEFGIYSLAKSTMRLHAVSKPTVMAARQMLRDLSHKRRRMIKLEKNYDLHGFVL